MNARIGMITVSIKTANNICASSFILVKNVHVLISYYAMWSANIAGWVLRITLTYFVRGDNISTKPISNKIKLFIHVIQITLQ